jgi:flagellin
VSIGGIGMTGTLSTMFGNSTAGTVTNYNGESSAIAKAVAINAIRSQSGVLATAQKNEVTADTAIAAVTLESGDVYINGYDIGAVTVQTNDSTGALVTAINNKTTDTGVTASVNADGKLVLTAEDGRNIAITTSTAAIGSTSLGLSGTATNSTWLYRSSVRLNNNESFTISSANDVVDLTGTNTTAVSVAADVSTYNVASISLITQEDAQAAILTIDAALDDVNAARSQIGAVQNRLEFTVNNLNIASENMSASQSRIKDADFAAEVAAFTRNQIMVQAGVAMVAQANTSTQYALQLLR